ncbi:MAG: L-serine ammonia-lyase, iron-sulfur-dependent, subunit alpha [Spirochaetes bacterium]|nr:L-serine ammonia-lyase, iron-sulfur-dependent, subunit alpha [Spirochaetota bacterium]
MRHHSPISLFDTLGPIMTGPSSSHTAGVLRIGLEGRMLLGGTPDRIDLHFYGKGLARMYKGHLSDSAIVAGLLGYREDYEHLRDVLENAGRRGIAVTCHPHESSTRNPNTVDMRLCKADRNLRVVGITVGGGQILMTRLYSYPISLKGYERGLFVFSDDSLEEAAFRETFGSDLKKLTGKKQGDRTLWTCITGAAPSDSFVETIRKTPGVSEVKVLEPIFDYELQSQDPLFSSVDEMLRLAGRGNISIPALAVRYESRRSGLDEADVRKRITEIWAIMKKSIKIGMSDDGDLLGGFVQRGSGARMLRAVNDKKTLSGPMIGLSIARAIAVMETNGCSRCIAAAPTAGSCGVIPGVLATMIESRGLDEQAAIDALLVAAMIGTLIAMRASLSGSIGGCQSEIGVASAMAAGSLIQIAGGTPDQVSQAVAFALKNILGLICDPVAGPVEIPCIKRNSIGVANAFAAADMALSELQSAIPADEVIGALVNTQKLLPGELKGTMIGGLASTPTALCIKKEWEHRVYYSIKTGATLSAAGNTKVEL